MWKYKKLCLNGLNFKFIMKEDIKRFLVEFHHNGVFPRGCNSTFITLIPRWMIHKTWRLPSYLIGGVYV